MAATAGFGFAVHAIADAAWPRLTDGKTTGGASVDHWLGSWALVPNDPVVLGRFAYCALVASVLALVLLKGRARLAAFVPVLYLAACVWENVLVVQPAVARYILLGGMLVAMMAARPQGLLGTTRVEIA
jgi:hypothetical protein